MQVRRRADEGFSVLEVAVAVGLIFSVVILLMYAGVVALLDVSHSRQRQGATGLANESLEQIRALPFASLALGMVTSDIVAPADANISRTGASAPYTYSYRGETIPHGSHAAGAPLFPHRRTVSVESTTYTVSTYVTRYKNSLTNNTLRATAEVTWANPMRKGVAPKVEVQTVLHPGGGCQSTALHPYSGPCLAFFESIAQSQPGSVSIEGWFLDDGPGGSTRQVQVSLTLLLPTQRSTFKSEQVSQVQQVVENSGVKLAIDGAPELTEGRGALGTAGDTDPSTARAEYETAISTDAALPLGEGSTSGNRISAVPSTGALATASSAAAARLPAAPCYLYGISEDDGEPCTRGEVSQPSTMQASLHVNHPAPLGVLNLASVTPGASGAPAARQFGFADRSRSSTSGCAGTVDGCARARATRSIGEVRIAGIPVVAAPPLWDGYLVRLRDLEDAVEVRAGRGVTGPTITRAGSIDWWNGSGYTSVDLSSPSAASTITSTLSTSIGGVTAELNAVFSVDAASTTTSTPCATVCDLSEATSASGSPMTGEIAYRLIANDVTVADFVIKVDVADASASTTYRAAG